MTEDSTLRFRPQIAFLDHVFAVVDTDTANAIANSEFLPGFGRFEVGTTVSDDGSWTGRYLFGRRTYVELFGPGDLQGPESQEGSIGLGLSTRSPGGLDLISDRMAILGSQAEEGRRMRREDDGELVAWFDYLDSVGPSEIFDAWAMEYLMNPSDLDVRETRYLDWSNSPGQAASGRVGPYISDVCLVRFTAPDGDIATAEPLLRAAGFDVAHSGGVLSADDADTTIELHATTGGPAGLQQVEFTLAAAAPVANVELIGRSRLSVGPGDRAVWDFGSPLRSARRQSR
jgi:Family of unknown function (DUF5829)